MRRRLLPIAADVARALGLVLGITVLVFMLVRVIPGDVVDLMALEGGVSDEAKAAMRSELGLDAGWAAQFQEWVVGALGGDFGRSLRFGRPVLDLVLHAIPPTLGLAGLSFLVGLALSVSLAVAATLWPPSPFPVLINAVNIWSIAMPTFCVGLLGILIFVFWLRWMPLIGNMVLPVAILGIDIAGQIVKPLHEDLKETSAASFVRTARAKGLGPTRIVLFHILPNSLTVLLALSGIVLATLVGGTITMEVLFGLPGIGKLALDAVLGRDYPLIQTVILLLAVAVITINLVTDLVARLVDPRLSR